MQPNAAGDRRGVDGVVEVRVADEDSHDLPGRMQEAVQGWRARGRCRRRSTQVAERDPGEVRVDEQRLAFVG